MSCVSQLPCRVFPPCGARGVAAVTIALGCVIGAATPILGFADEAQVPVEEQVVEHGQIADERPEDTQATAGEQAEDEQVSQLEGLGMRGAASASARDAASVARAPLLESFKFNMLGAFVIPYGVDVPSWLNAQDNLFQDGILIYQKLSAQEVAEEHFGGAGPFVYADGVSSYPGGTVSLADVLAWAEYNADEVKPPSMNGIEDHVTMQEVDEPRTSCSHLRTSSLTCAFLVLMANPAPLRHQAHGVIPAMEALLYGCARMTAP